MAVHSAGADTSPAGISVSRLLSNNPEAKEKYTKWVQMDVPDSSADRRTNGVPDRWADTKVSGVTDGKGAGVVDTEAAGAGVPLTECQEPVDMAAERDTGVCVIHENEVEEMNPETGGSTLTAESFASRQIFLQQCRNN
ncbi:hypothetical protein B0H14DRAFT_2606163 [Mycena olivaceomarginata]|nr:hypothetical protein B0H14DRAFT_2622423 [Mycena olivaceomarginata]KAJ7811889.1 hypothetical protein B0H14DRAFT_2606163 [Mycena olivaceomarginata]